MLEFTFTHIVLLLACLLIAAEYTWIGGIIGYIIAIIMMLGGIAIIINYLVYNKYFR